MHLLYKIQHIRALYYSFIQNKIIHAKKLYVFKYVNALKINEFYYLSDFSYGERLVLFHNGMSYAYINLLEDDVYNDFIDKVKSILNLHQKDFSEEKLQNIINHIFGMTCDRIQESEIDFAMNHKKCIYCAADDFEDLMAEPEKIICVEMPNVTHHAWKTLDDAKKVQRIEKALMENKVI